MEEYEKKQNYFPFTREVSKISLLFVGLQWPLDELWYCIMGNYDFLIIRSEVHLKTIMA